MLNANNESGNTNASSHEGRPHLLSNMKNKQIAEINNIGLRDSAIKAVNTLPDLIKVGSLKIERKNQSSARDLCSRKTTGGKWCRLRR